jgi:hypothetical protein
MQVANATNCFRADAALGLLAEPVGGLLAPHPATNRHVISTASSGRSERER